MLILDEILFNTCCEASHVTRMCMCIYVFVCICRYIRVYITLYIVKMEIKIVLTV